MAFEDLSQEDKIIFLRNQYNKLFDRFAELNAQVELQKEQSNHFIKMLADNILNKSSNDAIVEVFKKFAADKEPFDLNEYYSKITKEKFRHYIINDSYLNPEQKDALLKSSEIRPQDGN